MARKHESRSIRDDGVLSIFRKRSCYADDKCIIYNVGDQCTARHVARGLRIEHFEGIAAARSLLANPAQGAKRH